MRRPGPWIPGAAALAIAALCPPVARAALIEQDSDQWGAASLTLDTTTDLQWLDLTLSVNLTFNEVLVELEDGGQFEGFRYASLGEIAHLWTEAGITDFSGEYSPENVDGVLLLVELMGETNSLNGSLPNEGIGHIGLSPGTAEDANRSFVELSLDQTTARASLGMYTTPVDFILPDRIGHYLVRPLPAPGALVLLGLAGRSRARRRRA